VVLEGHRHTCRDVHGAVFEDDGPLFGVIDAIAAAGGVPEGGVGEAEVDLDISRRVESAVGAVAGDGELRVSSGGEQRGSKQREEVSASCVGMFHG
jgi:hypothetical protein